MEMSGVTRIEIQGRSDGDGMENTIFNERGETCHVSTIPKCYDTNFSQSGKRKEPKFIPYEPYKAATSPIVPTMKTCEKALNSKYVIDSQKVNSLASSIIKFNSSGKGDQIFDLPKTSENEPGAKKECCLKYTSKIDILETKIKELERDKKDLESQFNIQVKVNADLKKMLIASLGEDMELKVSYMTEDKARLGMNVLEFSEEIREKNEAIDRLSVECDIWKTKFEASSVMVNELATWKKSMSQKLNEAARSLNFLLKEHDTMFSQLQSCYSLLRETEVALEPSFQCDFVCDHPKSLATLMQDIQYLSKRLKDKLLRNSTVLMANMPFKVVRQLSPAEILASEFLSTLASWNGASMDNLEYHFRQLIQLLKALYSFNQFPNLKKMDSASNFKHGPGTTACEVLPHICTKETTVNCCKHCSGEIKCL